MSVDSPPLAAAKRHYREIVQRYYGRTIERGDLIRCPGDHANGDQHPSLHFTGPTGAKCHACGFGGTIVDFIMKEEGITKGAASRRAIELAGTEGVAPTLQTQSLPNPAGKPLLKGVGEPSPITNTVARYAYTDIDGDVVAYVSRTEQPGKRKSFLPQTWNGTAWVAGLQGRGPRPLYRLADLLARPDAPVLVCEGEKAADAAAGVFPEFVTVASMGGAHGADSTDWSPLAGRLVAVWPDNDEPGRQYAAAVAERVAGTRAIEVPAGLPRGWDLADAVPGQGSEQQATWRQIVSALEAARDRELDEPETPEVCAAGEAALDAVTDPLLDLAVRAADDAEAVSELVQRLRELSPFLYDQKRKTLAEAAGVRVSTLDAQVMAQAASGDSVGDSPFPSIPVWNEPVDGSLLLADLTAFFRRFIVLPADGDILLALWVLFAYSLDVFRVSPRLFITAPEKQCGKSRVLDVLAVVLVRVLRAASLTGALLPRVIEKYRPFILLDEVDTFVHGENLELAGILNSGHDKAGAWSWRCTGDSFEPTPFSTWGVYGFAGIAGKMPDTTLSRSIQLVMRRKRKDERVARLTTAAHAEGRALAARAARWAADNATALREVDEASDDAPWLDLISDDRAGDNWRPLIAVAEVCAGPWPQQAKAAAVRLSGGVLVEDDNPGPMLLADLRIIFEQSRSEQLPTEQILTALTSDDFTERPWCDWRRGQALTARGLARLLKPYGVGSKKLRVGAATFQGYALADLREAFDSYAPSTFSEGTAKNDDLSGTTEQLCEIKPLGVPDSSKQCAGSAAAGTSNPSCLLGCSGVPDKTAISGVGQGETLNYPPQGDLFAAQRRDDADADEGVEL